MSRFFFFSSRGRGALTSNSFKQLQCFSERTSRDKDKSSFCCRVFLILCVLKKVLCPINLQRVPRLSASFLQGPTACLAPRRGREDCPHLAAPTTTPGTGFDEPRRRSPPRRSGPKPQMLREAAPPTATRESERGNGNESGRKETRRSAKRRKIKTGGLYVFVRCSHPVCKSRLLK